MAKSTGGTRSLPGRRAAGTRSETLDPAGSPALYSMTLRMLDLDLGAMHGEAHVSTAQPEAEEQAWLPRAHEHRRRSRSAEPAPEEGPQAPDGRHRVEVSRARPAPARKHRLPRARRITRGRELRSLFQRGKRSRTAHLDVFDSPSPVAHPRAGIVVPRHKHSAVERNRLKRRLREILRQSVLPRLDAAGLPLDVVVRARREAYDAGFAELQRQLTEWADKRCSRGSSSA